MSGISVWRLCAAAYAETAFSGEGARLFGGRWSPVGLPLVYTAESRALAVLEVLAHVDDPERLRGREWAFIRADIPTSAIEKPERVPDNWRQLPHSTATQQFGAAWARDKRSAVLRVPSVIVPGEFNYLLNPTHPGFKDIALNAPDIFLFDPRLRK